MPTAASLPTRQSRKAGLVRRDIEPPDSWHEKIGAFTMRHGLRVLFKTLVRPPFPVWVHRAVIRVLGSSMPALRGVDIRHITVGRIPVERLTPRGVTCAHAVLFLHGGAFCAGSPRSHRSITTRLAVRARCEVWAPSYRLVPEHPFPAQIEDCVATYRAMLASGLAPERIAVGGDSAGGTLAVLLPFALRRQNLPLPGAMLLISPAMDVAMNTRSARERQAIDPLLNRSWGEWALKAYKAPHGHPLADPKRQDYRDLPPMMIQVGEHEILHDDALWLAEQSARHGNSVELEVCLRRWHVFQIHGSLMPSAEAAMDRMVAFLVRTWSGHDQL